MPRLAIPDRLLDRIAEAPEVWPALSEILDWWIERRAGRLEFEMGGFGLKIHQHPAPIDLAKIARPPEGAVWVCPDCTERLEVERDWGTRMTCLACDMTWTAWDLKARQSWRYLRGRGPGAQNGAAPEPAAEATEP